MVLEDNKHVNEESYTSTIESSSTIEKSEPIAEGSTTPTPQESNPNNPTSSTISINKSSVGLTALAVSIIGAIGSTVVYVNLI